MFSNKFTIHFVYLLIYLNCNIPICLLSFTFKIVGPLLTEFRIDQMAFGQSWPKASSSIRPKATSTEKIWSILKFTTDWPKADWPNGALAYWPKKFPIWFPKPQKQLWVSGQTNVSQRNQHNTFFGQSEISTADWSKKHTILFIQNVLL